MAFVVIIVPILENLLLQCQEMSQMLCAGLKSFLLYTGLYNIKLGQRACSHYYLAQKGYLGT